MLTSCSNLFTELVYCGQKLQDDKVLNDYSVQPGATVHALKKTVSDENIQISGIYYTFTFRLYF